jgi:hypothetical protein
MPLLELYFVKNNLIIGSNVRNITLILMERYDISL